jgi:hypothetical protein
MKIKRRFASTILHGAISHKPVILKLLLYVWEVPGSSLGPYTGYPDSDFCGFFAAHPGNTGKFS